MDGSLEIVQIDNRKAAMNTLMSAGAAYLMGNKTAAVMQAIGACVRRAGSIAQPDQTDRQTDASVE